MRRARLAACLAMLAWIALPSKATEPPGQPILLGTSWYPEQWSESRWEADLALMERAHVGFVRLAEFAWSTMEPREGTYEFTWLDRAIRAAERHRIRVVLGTPTCGPPAWLTAAYPDTLRTMRDGRRARHGERQQFDFSSPRYRVLAADITRRMAARYGHDPDVIGWQVDNEVEEESFGPETRSQFQAWLKARYVTLEALNARWTTAYWSEAYQDWSQIDIPPETGGNPGLMLAWNLFATDTWRGYVRTQSDIIRALADPRQKITTNQLGEHQAFDENALFQDVDFAAFDEYVGSGRFHPVIFGSLHDQFRGFKQQNHWVMETEPGTVNWSATNDSLERGEIRALAWNAIGHGADAVGFWQWRSALNGQEQYHGTLLGADGTPVPAYDEVAQIGREFALASPSLAGTTVQSDVAILNDYPSRWAISWQRHAAAFDALTLQRDYYTPLRAITRAVDIVAPAAPLAGYRLVVAPALNVLADDAARALEAYVRGGGHLVLGVRSGMKDGDNSLRVERQPGALAALLGARVAQFYALAAPVPVDGAWGAGQSRVWAERLDVLAPDVEILARYGHTAGGWLDGQPAAVTRKVGAGRITYVGAELDPASMARAASWMTRQAGLSPVLPDMPADVDVALRTGPGRRVLILINDGAAPRTIGLHATARDVLAGRDASSVTLPRYGVAVLELVDGPQAK